MIILTITFFISVCKLFKKLRSKACPHFGIFQRAFAFSAICECKCSAEYAQVLDTPLENVSPHLFLCLSKLFKNCDHDYTLQGSNNFVKLILCYYRFPSLLPLVTPESTAKEIISAVRKNLLETSIPSPLLVINNVFR